MALDDFGKYAIRMFVVVVLTCGPASAQNASTQSSLQGMWSDPPATTEGSFCFFACTDTGLARLNALLDNPANDARPFQELQMEARTFERQHLRSLLTPAALKRYPFDPADDPGFLRCEPWGFARQAFAPHQLEQDVLSTHRSCGRYRTARRQCPASGRDRRGAPSTRA